MSSPETAKAPSHIEEIAIAASTAVKTLLSTGTKRIDQDSAHARIVAYFVNDMIRIDVWPRYNTHAPTEIPTNH